MAKTKYDRIKEKYETDRSVDRIFNGVRMDAIRYEKKLPKSVRNILVANLVGEERAASIALKPNERDLYKNNMIGEIKKLSDPIDQISKALGIQLTFLDNGELCDCQPDGSSGLNQLIRQIQNVPGKPHPLFGVLNSLKQPC